MSFARAPFLVQDGCLYRSNDMKINGSSFWSIARKNNLLLIQITIARSPCKLSTAILTVAQRECTFLGWHVDYAMDRFLKRRTWFAGGPIFGPSLTKKPSSNATGICMIDILCTQLRRNASWTYIGRRLIAIAISRTPTHRLATN